MAVPDKATDAEDVEAAETGEEEAGQTDADIREETSIATPQQIFNRFPYLNVLIFL